MRQYYRWLYRKSGNNNLNFAKALFENMYKK